MRRDNTRLKMEELLRRRDLRMADQYEAAVDELRECERSIATGAHKMELRLQRVDVYGLDAEQQNAVLVEIAEIGADTERFCRYFGVDNIAEIPYHEVELALAALP